MKCKGQDQKQTKTSRYPRKGLSPLIVVGGSTGIRGSGTPVGAGRPDDFVAVYLDVLVLDVRIAWQRYSHFYTQVRSAKPQKTQRDTLTTPGRVTIRRERDRIIR